MREINLHISKDINGRSEVFVVLPDEVVEPESVSVISNLKNSVLLTTPVPSADELLSFSSDLIKELRNVSVKRATIIGIGKGGVLAQALALANNKLCRKVVLINSTCRLEPGLLTRAFDFIERVLPFGLPFRRISNEFDSRSFAHRIDCPALILNTAEASSYERRQARFFQKSLPNVWHIKSNSELYDQEGALSAPVSELIHQFLQIPTRRPQKNIEESELVLIGNEDLS